MTNPFVPQDYIEFSPPAGIAFQFWVGNTWRLHFAKTDSVTMRDWLATLANEGTRKALVNVAELQDIASAKKAKRYDRVLPEQTAARRLEQQQAQLKDGTLFIPMGEAPVNLVNPQPIPGQVAVDDVAQCEMMSCIHPPAKGEELCDMHLAQAASGEIAVVEGAPEPEIVEVMETPRQRTSEQVVERLVDSTRAQSIVDASNPKPNES